MAGAALAPHAWRLTDNEEAAWDALQEAWVAIDEGIGRLRDTAAFSAWAYRIVGFKARDWVRREADERSESSARADDLRQAVGKLPGDVRALLSLR